ncbi:translin associated factor X [Mytilinidion resinicola]|uniref:Translin associated factor X n=1 Tax=Mytilinidion resinicola TaxID=574789 RepID=A0A6A6Z4V3_9PEZI|nr:translin associated factor X [Mytilinidion resinicola]KAF2815205.1 translin associated factor X [Mytilinidion resinicola]
MEEPSKRQSTSPVMAMFEGFRSELDEHHDRRERMIKASRDITAASKKIVRALNKPLPGFVAKSNAQYWGIIQTQYKNISRDLQGLNAYRYGRNITGGNQEFMEALSFQHYLEHQNLITYKEANDYVAKLGGEGGPVLLTTEDYILGIFDMVGELMRFAITAMATSGELPGTLVQEDVTSRESHDEQAGDSMDVEQPSTTRTQHPQKRDVLADLRELRLCLEGLEPSRGSKFEGDAEKKMTVMRQCVEKVETALYGLIVRGQERPKGWVPDLREERRGAEAIEGY